MLMYLAPGALFAQTVTTDRAPGFHPAPFMVRLSASTTGATIHYTTDGSAPTEASPVFAAPIAIAPADTIRLAYIPTNHNVRADERWRAPTGRVFLGDGGTRAGSDGFGMGTHRRVHIFHRSGRLRAV